MAQQTRKPRMCSSRYTLSTPADGTPFAAYTPVPADQQQQGSLAREIRRTSLRTALLGAVSLLVACGGGGGSDGGATPPPGNPPPSGGIDRGGIAIGVISGFGSVIVNGVRYDTEDAQFIVDDGPGGQDDLEVGYKVIIIGTIDESGEQGDADTVEYESEVEGPIDAIDLTAGTLQVVGQTVDVRNDTVFDDGIDPPALAGLTVGDYIEVSGFRGADDVILATRIEREADRDEVEVTGIVANLDGAGFTFTLRALTVDYSAAVLEDFDGGAIVEGLLVEVEGENFGAGGELLATRVENESDDDREEGDFAELEGLITAFTSPADFELSGVAVATTGSTRFEGGTGDDLALGVRVEVEGEFDAGGVLVAEKIEIELPSNLELSGPIDAVDVGASRLTVLGVEIAVDAETQFEDDSDEDVPSFGLDDLRVGDFVEVIGAPDPAGLADLLARRVERDDADDGNDVELQGFVDQVDRIGGSITVLGVTVVGAAGDDEFADFLLQVTPGDLVDVNGMLIADGVIEADEIEFEEPEDNDGDEEDDEDEGDDDD
jgi:hypothetical protein